MTSTDLQVQLFEFAGGRPALAIEKTLLEESVLKYGKALAGSYSEDPKVSNLKTPHVMMCDARLPVYKLSYSGFVKKLKLDLQNGVPKLEMALVATVHPKGDPTRIIATYEVSLDNVLKVDLSYSKANRELRWYSHTSPVANVSPSFTADAENILNELSLPEPVLETYQAKVENVIIWQTADQFTQLVLEALPPIDLGELAPWLTFHDPLKIDFGDRYILATSEKATMTIGGCITEEVVVEPDPEFPYGMSEPIQNERSKTSVAVYLPKKRLVDFVAKNVMPAIMYDTGERGGIIKWRMNGAMGLKKFSVDVSGGIQVGNPWSGRLSLRGTLSTSTAIALTGVARSWVKGPCGVRVGLASASIQGDGEFAADIVLNYQSPSESSQAEYGAAIEAELTVTKSELSPNIDIDAVGWPIDNIIEELTDHLIKKEIHKLSGVVRKLGRWEMVGVPSWMVDALPKDIRGNPIAKLGPVIESLDGVSSIIGITKETG